MISLSPEENQRVLGDIKFRLTGRDSEMFASHLLYAFALSGLGDSSLKNKFQTFHSL
jgi:hypothetical protein